MTESDWLGFDDPVVVLHYNPGRPSDRQLRLFGCACCRRIWELFPKGPIREAVEVAERFADGLVDAGKLAAARSRVNNSVPPKDWNIRWAAFQVVREGARESAAAARNVAEMKRACWPAERRRQAALLRDILGNPFRPLPALDPAWRAWQGGTVVRLAQHIYDHRDFASLPILADALEECGSNNESILDHCRQGGEHVRGCHVVDWALGKL
jgi:hypothetical protein